MGIAAPLAIAADPPKPTEPIFLKPADPPKIEVPDRYEGMIIEIAADGTLQLDGEPLPDLSGLDQRLARWVTSVKFISPRIVLDPTVPSNNVKRLREIILIVRKHTEVYDVPLQ
ncbi:hypothetical protein [Roseimicrobium gellanilyticum]|uniref:hypothetical protein n=1 Tax=Roseimicrobium gellanilyticum TaxID=748857 RepID=UPI001B881985|nr:hypothetical protein [Roseimicrobium gellanilyticum]